MIKRIFKSLFFRLNLREKQLIKSSLDHTLDEYISKYNLSQEYKNKTIESLLYEIRVLQDRFSKQVKGTEPK
ncbi:hypothetical protein G9F73_012650 [Clostridium estertheticum]|uniref:hypothetical protein n=1 Tax=Clostridium estertheticum TaxID=238834 RepID=UPI0013EEC973|nr:hypothetical protein [Clostridium estertheticum]MBZ9608658.1 hypothetical protein [Clostridium estertheticum]